MMEAGLAVCSNIALGIVSYIEGFLSEEVFRDTDNRIVAHRKLFFMV
ncbi:hypothetical protein LBYZC6_30680 [Lacrimispora brassicae]